MRYKRYQTGKATCLDCGHEYSVLAPTNVFKMECPECGKCSARWNRWLREMGINPLTQVASVERSRKAKRGAASKPKTTLVAVGNYHRHLL